MDGRRHRAPHSLDAAPTLVACLAFASMLAAPACSCDEASDDGSSSAQGGGGQGGGELGGGGQGGQVLVGGANVGGFGGSGNTPNVEQYAELWYSVYDVLVHVELDPANGAVAGIATSTLPVPLPLGQNAITMTNDGGLLGARLSEDDNLSYFYRIEDPPRDGSDAVLEELGVMPDAIRVEGLYTDCDGRLYAMDTGEDNTNAIGNRLLRFTGDVLAGDFSYVVVSDLASADVADIDDMSPGIDGADVTDNPGLALDTGNIYDFDYETGTGTQVAMAGTYGIHALGGALFDDGVARLYVLNALAELYEVDPTTFTVSDVLATGPIPAEGTAGWSGLAGPLTDCESGFTPVK